VPRVNRKALRKSFWGALGRLIGVVMGAGGGSLLYNLIGSNTALGVSVAAGMIVASFFMVWFAEYERELD
jgi:hypothetical protein